MIIKNSFFIKKVTRKNPPKKTLRNFFRMRKKFYLISHFLTCMKIFFYSTWDIKLYIEVTKNYDMVTNEKSFLSHFFCVTFYL